MWIYEQATGRLLHDGKLIAVGYSGFGPGKNSPAKQRERGIGPIPAGHWRLGPTFDSEGHGPLCCRLVPCHGTETFGRDGFLCYGDSRSHPGQASRGCIIMPHDVREQMARSTDRDLQVVQGSQEVICSDA